MKNKKRLVLCVDALIAAFALLAPFFATLMMSYIPTCVFYRRGFLCSTCGATRCVYSFFSGNLATAFEYNQFIFILIFYLAFVLLVWNASVFFDNAKIGKVCKAVTHPIAICSLAVLFAIFGIFRNFVWLLLATFFFRSALSFCRLHWTAEHRTQAHLQARLTAGSAYRISPKLSLTKTKRTD